MDDNKSHVLGLGRVIIMIIIIIATIVKDQPLEQKIK
jgi:hypothetical protein